jgi:hypothetical protein
MGESKTAQADWVEDKDTCLGHANKDMTEKRECFVSLAVLSKTYQLKMGDIVKAKVRALSEIGWGEYGPPNNDGFRM